MPRDLNTAKDVWGSIAVGRQADCWPWLRSVSSGGYGQFFFEGRLHTAHRVAYELTKGAIPEGLQLDHLCRNRRCCNPDHLEPVTAAENTRRSPIHNVAKTHCPQGHPYDTANTARNRANGGRVCRTCSNAESRERKRRARQSARDSGPGCPGSAAAATHTE